MIARYTARFTDDFIQDFEAAGNSVNIRYVDVDDDPDAFRTTLANEVAFQLGTVDGYFIGPNDIGLALEYNGLADITPFIRALDSRIEDWNDIFVGYRRYVSQYEGRIVSVPVGGDTELMYYRRDILDYFNLTVPRTWEEYGEVASKIHGQTYEGIQLIGSCIGRRAGQCPGFSVANMIIASITQTKRPTEGHLFDTKDLNPLITPAVMEEVLRLLDLQVKYGSSKGMYNFDRCFQVFL